MAGTDNPLRGNDLKAGVVSRSLLLEAAETLKQYLYLSKTNDLASQIALAGTSALSETVMRAQTKAQENMNVLRSVVTGEDPAPRSEVIEAANAVNEQEKSQTTQDLLQQSVAIFANGAGFSPNFEKGNEEPIASARSDITHVMVSGTGKANNFSVRNAEFVAIFANLIPSVELSKCVPYFSIRFIQDIPNDNRVAMPFLSLDSFLGAVRSNTGNIASGDTPFAPSGVTPVNMPTSRLNSTVTGMELFQAPQTLVRPGINLLANYKANRGIAALDPLQPLASIESVSFDVSALSQNFMSTNTRVDLSIILHDKSRLIELSPLITPGVYPTIKAEIEWGWSHPDTSKFTSNPYAKFLNSLRNKQIYCLNAASFNNRDTTSMSIKLQLTGIGEFVASSTSIYTGNYVSYELVRSKMNTLFSIRDEKQKDGTFKQTFVGAHEQPVSLSNWENSNKWIRYTDFQALSALMTTAQQAGGSAESVTKLIQYYGAVLRGEITPTADPVNLSLALQTDIRESFSNLSITDSPYIAAYVSKNIAENETSGEQSQIEEFIKDIVDEMFEDAGAYKVTTDPASGTSSTEAIVGSVTTLGDCLYRLYSIPMSLTKTYDEIRVITFDFNEHAGNMGGINIGAFPIISSDVASAVLKPKLSVQKAIQEVIKIANNPAAVPYGVKKALLAKKEAEDEVADDESLDEQGAEVKLEEIRDQFEEALAIIYKNKSEKGWPYALEPKFTIPRVKIHTEVTPVKEGDVYKQVLNVFVYDEANTGYCATNLLSSIMQQESGLVRVVQPGNSDQTSAIKIEISDVTSGYTASIDRAQAKKIIMAAIPTIRIGTEGSLITNASYSSTAAGDLSNLNLLRGIKDSGGASAASMSPGIDADLFVIPSTLSITMAGMPRVNRGQTFFIDFGTGSTLDNTYTVTAVKHSMKQGSFTTSIQLNVTNQGTIKSVKSKLVNDVLAIDKFISGPVTTLRAISSWSKNADVSKIPG